MRNIRLLGIAVSLLSMAACVDVISSDDAEDSASQAVGFLPSCIVAEQGTPGTSDYSGCGPSTPAPVPPTTQPVPTPMPHPRLGADAPDFAPRDGVEPANRAAGDAGQPAAP